MFKKYGSVYDKSISDLLVDIPRERDNSFASPKRFDSFIPIFPKAPSNDEKPAPTVNCPVALSAIETSMFALFEPTCSSKLI